MKIKFLYGIALTVIFNGFLLGSAQSNESNSSENNSKERAIKEIAKHLFDIAQNCTNQNTPEKMIETLQKVNDPIQLLIAFNQENELKQTPEKLLLEQAQITRSLDCAH